MESYEKKYKEALERAKKFIEENPLVQNLNTWIKETFPELAKGEDEIIRKEIKQLIQGMHDADPRKERWLNWLEKQGEQKSQRMISAEAKEAMYDKPADKVEQKCDESETKVFDAPTPFEDKLYAFVLACEILDDTNKQEFILEHSQELLEAAREQIGKEQSSTWSEEDRKMINKLMAVVELYYVIDDDLDKQSCLSWLESFKQRIGG